MKKLLCIILSLSILWCAIPCVYAENSESENEITDEISEDEYFEDELLDEELQAEEPADDVVVDSVVSGGSTLDDVVVEEIPVEPEVPEITESVLVYEKEIEVLQVLDVLHSKDYTKTISRAEFVSSVVSLCGYSGETLSANGYFSDIPREYGYESAIAYAAGIKLVQGDGANFRPDDPVTAEEAGIILLRALGYDKFSPYITVDLVKARQEGIYDGVTAKDSTLLTFDTAAKLIYNAMNQEMILVQGGTLSESGSTVAFEKSGRTLLNYYRKIHMTEGRITDNGYTTYMSDSGISDNLVKIDTTIYEKGNTNIDELLGHEVEAYYDEDNMLLCVYDITPERNVLCVNSRDIVNSVLGSLSYENENGKVRSITYPTNANIIYNGKALKSGEFDQIDLKPEIGEIKLIRTTGNDYDLVVITSYYNCVVNKVNVNDNVITVLDLENKAFNTSFNINDLGGKVKLTDASGNNYSYEHITTYHVLSVAKSLDGELLNIKVSNSKVSGIIESISNNNGVVIRINGVDYTLSYGANTDFVAVNTYGDCWLDIFGNVALFNSYAKWEQRFGYLLKVRVLEDEVSTFVIKVFDPVGKMFTFAAENKIIADGIVYKGDRFSELAASFYNGTEFQPCMIRYELNLDGSLKAIDTATRTSSETIDTLHKLEAQSELEIPHTGVYSDWVRYESAGNVFDGQIFVDKNTIILGIPFGECEDEDYRVLPFSFLGNNKYYDFEAYTSNGENQIAEIMTVRYAHKYDSNIKTSLGYVILPSLLSTSMVTAVVDEITVSVDENGELEYNIDYIALTDGILHTAKIRWPEQAQMLRKGMVFRYYGISGRIIDVEPLFDLDTRTALANEAREFKGANKTFYVRHNDREIADSSTAANNTKLETASIRLSYLDVLSVKNGVLTGVTGDASMVWPNEYIDRAPTSKITHVFKYNSRAKKLEPASIDDVMGYDDAGDNCSKVLAFFNRTVVKTLIIFE